MMKSREYLTARMVVGGGNGGGGGAVVIEAAVNRISNRNKKLAISVSAATHHAERLFISHHTQSLKTPAVLTDSVLCFSLSLEIEHELNENYGLWGCRLGIKLMKPIIEPNNYSNRWVFAVDYKNSTENSTIVDNSTLAQPQLFYANISFFKK